MYHWLGWSLLWQQEEKGVLEAGSVATPMDIADEDDDEHSGQYNRSSPVSVDHQDVHPPGHVRLGP